MGRTIIVTPQQRTMLDKKRRGPTLRTSTAAGNWNATYGAKNVRRMMLCGSLVVFKMESRGGESRSGDAHNGSTPQA